MYGRTFPNRHKRNLAYQSIEQSKEYCQIDRIVKTEGIQRNFNLIYQNVDVIYTYCMLTALIKVFFLIVNHEFV